MRQFAFVLPEVMRRRLHRKYGFASLHEFASRVGGMSPSVVDQILYVYRKLENYPLFWPQVKNHGWAKLRVIANIVNHDNQNIWITNLQRTSKTGLEELVKIYREELKKDQKSANVNFLPETIAKNEENSLKKTNTSFNNEKGETRSCDKTALKNIRFNIDSETEFLFRDFIQKIEKEKGEAITMGEALKLLLTSAARKKQPKVRKNRPKKTTKVTRNISKITKQEVIEKQGGRCCISNCNRPIAEFHHPKRFALQKTHEYLVGVCKIHHQLAHGGFINESGNWQVNWQVSKRNKAVEMIDNKMRKYSIRAP